jgi:hypothetical protein
MAQGEAETCDADLKRLAALAPAWQSLWRGRYTLVGCADDVAAFAIAQAFRQGVQHHCRCPSSCMSTPAPAAFKNCLGEPTSGWEPTLAAHHRSVARSG